MMSEHVVYGLVLIFPEALQHEETDVSSRQQQLGHDFIGAAQVHQLDLGKIQQRGEAAAPGQGLLYSSPDGRTGGPGNQIAVGSGNRLAQQVPDPDGLDHKLSACWAGMMICTWDPGK